MRGGDRASTPPGNPVSYAPSNVYDQDMTTAWRCDGDGTGQKLTIDLADATKIGEVGLIPGLREDRRPQRRRPLRREQPDHPGALGVRRRYVGRAVPRPVSRRTGTMQSIRIPATKATRVVVEILGTERGTRNTIAVSELRIGRTAS